jgi:hypothetical protein
MEQLSARRSPRLIAVSNNAVLVELYFCCRQGHEAYPAPDHDERDALCILSYGKVLDGVQVYEGNCGHARRGQQGPARPGLLWLIPALPLPNQSTTHEAENRYYRQDNQEGNQQPADNSSFRTTPYDHGTRDGPQAFSGLPVQPTLNAQHSTRRHRGATPCARFLGCTSANPVTGAIIRFHWSTFALERRGFLSAYPRIAGQHISPKSSRARLSRSIPTAREFVDLSRVRI